MKALLFTVILTLITLLILAYFINKNTVKNVEKFDSSAADIYTLQTGQNQFETLTKLETDVSKLNINTTNLSTDFNSYKDDSTKKIGDIDTRVTSFQGDISGKMTNLQKLQDTNTNSIKDMNSKFTDFSGQLKSTNDNLTVINGQLVDITGKQQKQIGVLQENINTISTLQKSFPDQLTAATSSINNDFNKKFSTLQNDVTSKLGTQTDNISRLDTSLNSFSKNYNVFQESQNTVNTTQVKNINDLTLKTNTLNDNITNAQSKIIDISTLITNNYAKKSDLTPYVTTDGLKPYATNTQLSQYATKLDISNYIGRDELNNYIPRREVQPLVDSLSSANNSLTTLNNTVKTISSNYVTKTDLPKLALDATGATALSSAIDGANASVKSLSDSLTQVKNSLGNYYTKTEVDGKLSSYAMKTDLTTFAKQADLASLATTTQTAIANIKPPDLTSYAKQSDLTALANSSQSTYAKQSDLTALAASSQSTYAKQTDLNNAIANIKPTDLSQYAKITDVTNSINANATTNTANLNAAIANLQTQIAAIKSGTSSILDTMQVNQTLTANKINTSNGINFPNANGIFVEKKWGDGDTYGVGLNDSTTNVFASSKHGPAKIGLGYLNANGTYDNKLVVDKSTVNIPTSRLGINADWKVGQDGDQLRFFYKDGLKLAIGSDGNIYSDHPFFKDWIANRVAIKGQDADFKSIKLNPDWTINQTSDQVQFFFKGDMKLAIGSDGNIFSKHPNFNDWFSNKVAVKGQDVNFNNVTARDLDSTRTLNSGPGARTPSDTGQNFFRRDGRITHFDWVGNGQNYLRGVTNVDDIMRFPANDGGMIEKKWGDGDQYGIGVGNNGQTQIFASGNYGPATVGLGFKRPDQSMDARFIVDKTNIYSWQPDKNRWASLGVGVSNSAGQGWIFKNGPGRGDDGGPNTMTIRNDDGRLRLRSANNDVQIDGSRLRINNDWQIGQDGDQLRFWYQGGLKHAFGSDGNIWSARGPMNDWMMDRVAIKGQDANFNSINVNRLCMGDVCIDNKDQLRAIKDVVLGARRVSLRSAQTGFRIENGGGSTPGTTVGAFQGNEGATNKHWFVELR